MKNRHFKGLTFKDSYICGLTCRKVLQNTSGVGVFALSFVRRYVRFHGTRGTIGGYETGRVEQGTVYRTSICRGVANVYGRHQVGPYGVTRGVVGSISHGLTYNIGVGTIGTFRGLHIVEGFGVKRGQVTRFFTLGVFAIILASQRTLVGRIEGGRRSFNGLFNGLHFLFKGYIGLFHLHLRLLTGHRTLFLFTLHRGVSSFLKGLISIYTGLINTLLGVSSFTIGRGGLVGGQRLFVLGFLSSVFFGHFKVFPRGFGVGRGLFSWLVYCVLWFLNEVRLCFGDTLTPTNMGLGLTTRYFHGQGLGLIVGTITTLTTLLGKYKQLLSFYGPFGVPCNRFI